MSWQDIIADFGGEVGPVFTLASFTAKPLPDLILFDPWIIAIARLVPSALWPEKPTADYLLHINSAFTVDGIENAGVAATQHLEMLAQFGWLGLPFLAFLYFTIAIFLVSRLNRLGREARIAGCALVPAFFGFFMQQRGYFFMTLSEGLFVFGPLFIVHLWDKQVTRRARQTTLAAGDGSRAPQTR